MDLKPENIVLSKDLSAILIDPSGIGGTTRKWLSPEMRLLPEPLSQDFEARKQNDIWALGEIISAMADATCDEMERKVLRKISLLATAQVPPRIPLRDIISILSPASTLNGVSHQNAAQSTSSGSKPPSVLPPR
jgi:serine/threonine protein kinase